MKAILIAIYIFCTVTAFAQFTGGNGSGATGAITINSSCSSANTNPYKGGTADGHANNRTVYSFCTVASTNPYAGGTGDGHVSSRLTNSVCTYASTNVYAGGNGDGHGNYALTNAVCLITSTNPYAGGNADGHAHTRLLNIACSYTVSSPYLGGTADGHASLRLSNVTCSIVASNPYRGGYADGYAFAALTNTTCSTTSMNPYRGGRNDMYNAVVDIICGASLPVELLNFNATPEGRKVAVVWATASEKNSDYFSVEKSKDGSRFLQFDHIKSSGNSTRIINYKTFDHNPFGGTSYYRLKQTDLNGEFQYSKIVEVSLEDAYSCNIFPNPGNGQKIFVSLTGKRSEVVEINIYDAGGMEVFKSGGRFEKEGEKTFTLEMKSRLDAGVYLVVITTDNKTINRKLVVE